ncbi:MAG TPA: VIT1/CCC1 transporter family protein, partial [Methylomirabilota bacterium]|nr:VIT1/CCC1 transporter family protein [Methylomirabilota bacterium]
MGSSLSPEDLKTKAHVTLLSSIVRRMRGRQWRIVPHPGPINAEQRTGGKSGALRAAIFGANDGLVSNMSLIFGVAGAGQPTKVIIVAGVAGLLAGAFSMAAGEYISVRVQREVFERLIHLEAHEIGSDAEAEQKELALIYERKGISRDLAERLAEELMRDPDVALETHAREELGLDPGQGLGSPWAAAGSSFATFSVGALVPLVPFLFGSGDVAVIVSAVLALATLFGIGAGMSYLTGKRFYVSGLRMFLIGGTAALITFGV